MHKGQFEKHYLIDAALKITKNAPCWSYFTTLIIFTVFLIQLIMDALLIGIFVEKQPEIDAQIEELDSISHTVRDE